VRKLVVNTFITLDGVMQAPGGPEEDPTGDFNYGGWSFNYWDGLMGQVMSESMEKPFELLLGRKTYEIFAAHWPFMKDDPVAELFNKINKYVVSKSLEEVDWKNSFLIKNDIVREINKLKENDGPELQVHGSSNLLQTLIKQKLIDEFRIWIFPVTIGKGKRLFDKGTIPSGFKLIDSKISSTGVIIASYIPDGEIKSGSFALDNPTEAEIERRKKLSSENKN
jgi:dihydrofolate reductase